MIDTTTQQPAEAVDWADVVVVGAGTAGCVLAERLSREPDTRVLVLEAGPRDRNPWIHIPVGFSRLMHDPSVNWCFATEPQEALGERRLHWPRGRVVGGSSSINGMVWVRGQPRDYDAWAEVTGDPGWTWEQVEPHFRAIEQAPDGADERLGRTGDMPLSRVPFSHPLVDAFVRAAQASGHSRRSDLSISDTEGFGEYLISTRSGLRATPAAIYLKPALRRPNLRLMTHAHVQSLEFADDDRATAVEVLVGTRRRRVSARRAVVLAAGTVGSPHLLMLSGVGPADALRRAGVSPRLDIPDVGANLQDHFGVRVIGRVDRPVTINDDFRRPWRLVRHALEYAITRGGPVAIGGAYAGAFYRSSEQVRHPDIQVHFLPLSSRGPGWRFDRFSGFTMNVCHLRPHSRGCVSLASANPMDAPLIDPGYLGDDRDLGPLLSGIKIARDLFNQAPLSREYGAVEVRPGPQVQDDEGLVRHIRETGQTVYHPVGTCRMGRDAASVVDSRMRVRGVPNLWVVDASVMPSIPSGNTQAGVLMLARRGAQFVHDALQRREDP